MSADGPLPFEVVDEQLAARYRAMSPEERVRLGLSMRDLMFRAAEAGVRARHPDWDSTRVRDEAIERLRRAAG